MDESSRGVKVLSEKTGFDDNFQNTGLGPELNSMNPDIFSLKLQIRFQPIIRFRFSNLTPDDEFPKFRV